MTTDMAQDLLERILITKKEEIAQAQLHMSLEKARELAQKFRPRDFIGALQMQVVAGKPGIIAEIKKASPSKGLLRANFEPRLIAAEYATSGAHCLSVLTDKLYFQGAPEYLALARDACSLPVLRKDFIVSPYQVYQSALWGADAILLIVAALPQELMVELEELAQSLGLAVVVEVHDEEELMRALKLKSPLIGINNRNLRTFEVNLSTTLRLIGQISQADEGRRIVIAESGITTPKDVAELTSVGVHAFLVGEVFMRADKPGDALRELFFNGN